MGETVGGPRREGGGRRGSDSATWVRAERRSRERVDEGVRERAREQPSPAAASGRRENVYCCPSWRPISIAVLRSPPPFRLFPSTEGVRYRSRTMETSTAMARPVVVIQPDYSSSPLHSLLSFSLFRSPGSFPPLRCYSDNQINSLRVLKTPPLCRVILPAEPSRVESFAHQFATAALSPRLHSVTRLYPNPSKRGTVE